MYLRTEDNWFIKRDSPKVPRRMCWVLWWEYPDGSGTEVVRVYSSQARAEEDLEIVKTSGGKSWYLTTVPLMETR